MAVLGFWVDMVVLAASWPVLHTYGQHEELCVPSDGCLAGRCLGPHALQDRYALSAACGPAYVPCSHAHAPAWPC